MLAEHRAEAAGEFLVGGAGRDELQDERGELILLGRVHPEQMPAAGGRQARPPLAAVHLLHHHLRVALQAARMLGHARALDLVDATARGHEAVVLAPLALGGAQLLQRLDRRHSHEVVVMPLGERCPDGERPLVGCRLAGGAAQVEGHHPLLLLDLLWPDREQVFLLALVRQDAHRHVHLRHVVVRSRRIGRRQRLRLGLALMEVAEVALEGIGVARVDRLVHARIEALDAAQPLPPVLVALEGGQVGRRVGRRAVLVELDSFRRLEALVVLPHDALELAHIVRAILVADDHARPLRLILAHALHHPRVAAHGGAQRVRVLGAPVLCDGKGLAAHVHRRPSRAASLR